MGKEQLNGEIGIKASEQKSEFVTIPRSEYEELKQDRKDAIKYSGMWRRKYDAVLANFETLKKTLDVISQANSELRKKVSTGISCPLISICSLVNVPDSNEPKNCKPYTGPKVVQMFPKSK